jgi:deoxyribodipyrimidine photo-lyase
MFNRRFEPAAAARDQRVASALRADRIEVTEHDAALLWQPEQVRNQSGAPFRVYTPFWKHVRQLGAGRPLPVAGAKLRAGPACNGLDISALGLLPRIDWDGGFRLAWDPTLKGAHQRLDRFAADMASGYAELRDRPDQDGTSRLSPYLHFGQLGPRQVWQAIHESGAADTGSGHKYLAEIAWREFAHHLLHHFPDSPTQALNPGYRNFPWREDAELLARWQQGRTGFPIVDAGMRQLWRTGWMHNRVRMIAASVLVKHLLQPWQCGARWFWDTLVDADLASNTMGWQWVAGCGADAAPYFRIFNPVLQGQKFDPHGDYVREWVPELAALPNADIHQPWAADPAVLQRARIQLEQDYPLPAVGLKEGRQRALDALQAIKQERMAAAQPPGERH